jgi:BRCT domain type II-containing protein
VLASESAGSKLDKARERGIKVIDEAAFRSLLGGGPPSQTNSVAGVSREIIGAAEFRRPGGR